MNAPHIDTASVKVMRSHDYCHFEVCLSSTLAYSPEIVDELRKTAARLADKAVAQYKIAKANAQRQLDDSRQRGYLISEMKMIEEKPEGDRTVREQATLKAYKDENYTARRAYDYEDDWADDQDPYPPLPECGADAFGRVSLVGSPHAQPPVGGGAGSGF